MQADFDGCNLNELRVQAGRGEPCPAVGAALRWAGPALDRQAQYLADLEVIERCEQQLKHQAGCQDFFGCMGELQAGRARG